MDIKLKNKLLTFALLFLFTIGISGITSTFSASDYYINKDYFETEDFESTVNQLFTHLNMFELNHVPSDALKEAIVVTDEEINEHRYRYGTLTEQVGNINEQYEPNIQEAVHSNNNELADMYRKERDEKIEDITTNFSDDEHVRAKIVNEKEQRIDEYYRELENYRGEYNRYKDAFQYYLVDMKTGDIYTNVDSSKTSEEGLKNKEEFIFFRTYPSRHSNNIVTDQRVFYTEYGDVEEMIRQSTSSMYEGQIAISKKNPSSNFILENYYDFKQRQIIFFSYAIFSLIALALSIYLYKKTTLLHSPHLGKWNAYYNRIPIDIKVIVFGISTMITLALLFSQHFYYYRLYPFIEKLLVHGIITTVFVTLVLLQGKLLYDRYKDLYILKEDWQKSIVVRVFGAIQDVFLNRSVGFKTFLLLAVVFAFGFGAVVVILNPVFLLIYLPAFVIFALPILVILVKRIGYFNRMIRYTNEIAIGNFEADLPVEGKSVLASHVANINTLKHGVKTSLKEQAKSERLKAELITNVSHDLRTPLTSIMTYTELLKSPSLSDDERNSYIKIIDRKSKRLKVLIDDLFEASKMASGTIELSKEKVDLVQLLQQALAEYDEKMKETTLQFRITQPETPVYAVVDGQKIWRVFDNLIGNIFKYSLEGTRVYISIDPNPNEVAITFKNVTKYELGGNIDEMFERFKRGDTSRHTEGSGLGLAIAKSIVDLHDGSMDIEVDGDLFKVSIKLNSN
ncbi:histidine kinase dimerization/phospho-acceptor domain-containing protein [Anaerobacillus sp. MEB173]|uniref:sensor histidine kinase n=1 Tax=Anaerobacillus sp. MEB173 TaxID=3383345 RepID=UPI003F9326C4